jgi:SAM-dependent methyltransferase
MNNFKNTREVVHHVKKYITGKTLDFGAGRAKYKGIIAPQTASYTAFDMMPGDAIDVVGDALKPPFPDASFDTVISTQVLEHVEKPWVMIKEINRILKKDGVCIMTAPFMVPYHADPHDYFRYTKEGLASLFRNEGFEILENDSYGKTFSVLSEMIHFVFFSHYTPRSATSQRWVSRLMRILKPGAAKLDRLVKNKVLYPNSYVVARKK